MRSRLGREWWFIAFSSKPNSPTMSVKEESFSPGLEDMGMSTQPATNTARPGTQVSKETKVLFFLFPLLHSPGSECPLCCVAPQIRGISKFAHPPNLVF